MANVFTFLAGVPTNVKDIRKYRRLLPFVNSFCQINFSERECESTSEQETKQHVHK